jgi:hypothetical protein
MQRWDFIEVGDSYRGSFIYRVGGSYRGGDSCRGGGFIQWWGFHTEGVGISYRHAEVGFHIEDFI